MMVGILILNYNNTSDIVNCVDSICDKMSLTDVKILVVDNGSSVEVKTTVGNYLQNKFGLSSFISLEEGYDCSIGIELPSMTYLLLSSNLGYARGNNAGIRLLSMDSTVSEVLVLNSDIILSEDILPPLLKRVNSLDQVGAVSPLLRKPDGRIDYCCARRKMSKRDHLLTFSYVGAKKYSRALDRRKILKDSPHLLENDIVEIDLPSGSCMLFKKDVLIDIGGFDDGTFLYYEEDLLYRKLNEKGKISYLVPGTSCIHVGGATTNNSKTAYFLKKCNYESLLYYLEKYEECSRLEMLRFKCAAKVRLLRLWLGMCYHRLVD